jgi:hypothetical protein
MAHGYADLISLGVLIVSSGGLWSVLRVVVRGGVEVALAREAAQQITMY